MEIVDEIEVMLEVLWFSDVVRVGFGSIFGRSGLDMRS
jgi:hypothetical protein